MEDSCRVTAYLRQNVILCLQEVQEDHYETQVKPSLESLGYHCEYKKRTGNKVDGCAVVFKQASFSLVSCHPVEYFKRDIPLLDRDNVGLVLLLKPKLEKERGSLNIMGFLWARCLDRMRSVKGNAFLVCPSGPNVWELVSSANMRTLPQVSLYL
ncbi:hypothetical protein AALO_G00106710 [Alosa alosa]|uniref:Uncharacterized protein n=1 Tax=Alosa alosa TaxID=278164 RepID=A0AAV6GMU6_9TELE|nr:hypothetical protein AALO_G00106710 [Alosa alosa]